MKLTWILLSYLILPDGSHHPYAYQITSALTGATFSDCSRPQLFFQSRTACPPPAISLQLMSLLIHSVCLLESIFRLRSSPLSWLFLKINAISRHLFSYVPCALLLEIFTFQLYILWGYLMKAFWHAGLQGCPIMQCGEEHHLLLTSYEILTIHKNRFLVYFRVASPHFLYTAIAKTSDTLEVTPFFQTVTLKIDKPLSKPRLWFLCKFYSNRELLLQPLALPEKKSGGHLIFQSQRSLSALYLKPLQVFRHCHKKSCSKIYLLLQLLCNEMQIVSNDSLSIEDEKLLLFILKKL